MLSPRENPTRFVGIKLVPTVFTSVSRLAKRNNLSVSMVIREAVDQFLARELKEAAQQK